MLNNYAELCRFCDNFWDKLTSHYADMLHCAPGCSDCCGLESVCALEAHILWNHLRNMPNLPSRSMATIDDAGAACPFLYERRCLVYPARPLICRTLGLPIQSAALTNGQIDCCPLNFTDGSLPQLGSDFVLDLDMITDNLMRLNLAFCMVQGNKQMAGERFKLDDIYQGNIPDLLR